MSSSLCIGLTGQLASGKGVVAEILEKEFGFSYYSLSQRVREVAKTRKIINVWREILQDIGDEMRQKFGGDILAKLTAGFAFVGGSNRIVIDSIRNPAEVEFLKQHPRFVLMGVTAPREKRFLWMRERARPSDPTTWEEFVAIDTRDLGIEEDAPGQQVGKCLTMTNIMIINSGSLREFRESVRDKIFYLLLKSK